jgi:hypothetical protein
VLDFSERSPAAAITGMVLTDLGAEIIRSNPRAAIRCLWSPALAYGCAAKRA